MTMYFRSILVYAFLSFHIACATSINSTFITLPAINDTLGVWPPVPFASPAGLYLSVTYTSYGRRAVPSLLQDILFEFDVLRRLMLHSSQPFTDNPTYLQSSVVLMTITFLDGIRISKQDVAQVITTLEADMERYGPTEIANAIVGRHQVVAHRPETYTLVADVKVGFSTLEVTE